MTAAAIVIINQLVRKLLMAQSQRGRFYYWAKHEMMLCRNGKKVLPFLIERGLTRMTDNQQQPYEFGQCSAAGTARTAGTTVLRPRCRTAAAGLWRPTARRIRSTRRRKLRPAATAIRPARRRIRSASVRPAAVRPARQPAAGYGQQPGYGQAYQQPNAYAQPQCPTAAPYAAAPVGNRQVKLAAGLLGIFLGGLGVHNFYLGNTGKAVAQLLLTLVGWILLGLGPIAAAIWGFVEGIIILCSKPGSPWHKDANGYELSD